MTIISLSKNRALQQVSMASFCHADQLIKAQKNRRLIIHQKKNIFNRFLSRLKID